MPQPTDDDTGTTSRREVLKATTAAAAAGVGLAAGSAGAASVEPADHCEDPADEFTEVTCSGTPCVVDMGGPFNLESRHCVDCNGDGTYECSDWQLTGSCCG